MVRKKDGLPEGAAGGSTEREQETSGSTDLSSLEEILQNLTSKMDTFQTSIQDTRQQCADALSRMEGQGATNQQQQEFNDKVTQELGNIRSLLRDLCRRPSQMTTTSCGTDDVAESSAENEAASATTVISVGQPLPLNQVGDSIIPPLGGIHLPHSVHNPKVPVPSVPLQSSSGSSGTQVVVVEPRNQIPVFEAKSPAASPLERNNELDYWLRQIELQCRPTDDETRIRAARMHCKGDVERVINSSLFFGVVSWEDFKAKVQAKFRGTSSATEFLSLLASKYLRDDQSPQDFHLEVESASLSGQRDYSSLGDVSELIRRTFLAGLPPYLQSAVASLDQSNMEDLVAAAQRVWTVWQRARQPSNTRYGTRPERSVQFTNPPLENGSTQVAATARADLTPYCYYHRAQGHRTSECRMKPEGNVCWGCKRFGHVRQRCPFREPERRAPTSDPTVTTSNSSGTAEQPRSPD